MRKILATIISIALSLIMCVSALGGCSLIEVDSEKDMNQVVATVRISEEVPEADEILKKDILMAYINYYYQLEYQGTSREDVIKQIVKALIENRVLVQKAILDFESGEEPFDGVANGFTPWDLNRYLDEEERIDQFAIQKTTILDDETPETPVEPETPDEPNTPDEPVNPDDNEQGNNGNTGDNADGSDADARESIFAYVAMITLVSSAVVFVSVLRKKQKA